MNDWNPALYSRFEEERTRPARDLLARCRLASPDGEGLIVADLGCGPGNSTELLLQRFPKARIIGYDRSEAMLAAARERLPGCRFERADAADWRPGHRFDLVYSNALLQWVRDHETLLPRLLSHVLPGGVLAAQIPDNLADPSQTAMERIAAEPEFAPHLAGARGSREPIAPMSAYYDWLCRGADEVEVWLTVYQHPLDGPEAIADWFRATGLKPFLDPLPEALKARFLARYTRAMDESYPPRADGRRLLGFPRLFLVARRAADQA